LKTRASVICLLLLLTIVSFTSIISTQGVEEGDWITKYTVHDSSGKLLLNVDFKTGVNETYAPILAGTELTVRFTVDIFAGGAGNLRLSTSMQHSSLRTTYWELLSLNYSLGSWNPNSAAFDFNWVAGTFEMVCYGRIPTTAVKDVPVAFTLVQLATSSGDVLDQIKPYVFTAEMGNYQSLLEAKEEKLQSLKDSGVVAGYVELFENVIEQAKAEAALGYVDNAIALLNALDVSSEPASALMEALFLPAVVILIAVSAVLGFMFIRGRGKLQYILLVLEEQIRDLEGLTLRASKVDRTISSSLESVKDRLKSVVGM